jgi:DNA-binding Lrp family transcriptional regulator
MSRLDEQEIKIIRELIRNPRSSDNNISKRTGVPVMSVNRKRKALEEAGIIRYYTDIEHGENGTDDFHAEQMYCVKFKIGITAQEFINKIRNDKTLNRFNAEHIVFSYVGEKDGHLAFIMVINAHTEADLTESFNGYIVPMLKKNFGEDSIIAIETIKILEPVREHHNYIHGVNMEKGKIKDDWPNDFIFVDRKSFYKLNNNSNIHH